MKMKLYFINLVLILLVFGSCEHEDSISTQPFVAAFEKQSHNLAQIQNDTVINLVFSEPAKSNGMVFIKTSASGAEYGSDYATVPAANNGIIEISFSAGAKAVSFVYKNLMFPYDIDDVSKSMLFEVQRIDYDSETSIQGYISTIVSFGSSVGATLNPEIGGPNQGDQVFIDLSTELVSKVRRDSWDLGFYSGDQNRVIINGSLYMAAKNLNVTNIDAVNQASVQSYFNQVAVGTFDAENINYVDAPNGDITQTAIDVISDNPEENKVYLVNLGYSVGTTIPAAGSVAIAGNPRGWKKIRILKNGDGYTLQYANLNSNTHQEVNISKDAAYNFTFFSLTSNNVVAVEPQKTNWDLEFTVFTNEIVGSGSYGYSDFVVNNIRAGIKAYQVNTTSQLTYQSFNLANVSDDKFVENEQRIIGADWRDVFTGAAFSDRFYILKDADGNYYKIRMLAFVNEGGVRGYPKFEYQLLQ